MPKDDDRHDRTMIFACFKNYFTEEAGIIDFAAREKDWTWQPWQHLRAKAWSHGFNANIREDVMSLFPIPSEPIL